VAQLKQLIIPRLELCAATLVSKLYKKAIGALNITIHEYNLWTDNSIVLTWIQVPPNKWKTFVGNRIARIQEETASDSWRLVPSQSNPADLISSGIEPTIRSTSTLCWKGQQWLSQKPSSWPTTEMITPRVKLAIRNVHIACIQPGEAITQKLSNMNRFIRLIGYCK